MFYCMLIVKNIQKFGPHEFGPHLGQSFEPSVHLLKITRKTAHPDPDTPMLRISPLLFHWTKMTMLVGFSF